MRLLGILVGGQRLRALVDGVDGENLTRAARPVAKALRHQILHLVQIKVARDGHAGVHGTVMAGTESQNILPRVAGDQLARAQDGLPQRLLAKHG